MRHLWHGQRPTDKAQALRTDINGATMLMTVFKSLNLNYPPIYMPTMTQAEIHASIMRQAYTSLRNDKVVKK
jgi:hypothetical protein